MSPNTTDLFQNGFHGVIWFCPYVQSDQNTYFPTDSNEITFSDPNTYSLSVMASYTNGSGTITYNYPDKTIVVQSSETLNTSIRAYAEEIALVTGFGIAIIEYGSRKFFHHPITQTPAVLATI